MLEHGSVAKATTAGGFEREGGAGGKRETEIRGQKTVNDGL